MAENAPKNSTGMNKGSDNVAPNMNKSNVIRSGIFAFLMICLVAVFVANMSINNNGAKKTEVAISEVIRRANDPEGSIEKITVKGDKLDITLKGQTAPTETSMKDGSGTLYDMGYESKEILPSILS